MLLRLIAPALFFFFVIGLVLWMRRRAFRIQGADPAEVWFNYWRVLYWLDHGILIGWIIIANASGIMNLADIKGYQYAFFAWVLFAYWVPPTLLLIICHWLSYPLFFRIRKIDRARNDYSRQIMGRFLGRLVPIGCVILGLVEVFSDFRKALILFGIAIISGFVIKTTLSLLSPLASYVLTYGDLKDRIFDLAKKAGVKLQQIFIIPASQIQSANAYAMVGNNLILTDYLIEKLSKREVDSVVAHELGHLQKNHPRSLRFSIIAFFVFYFFFGDVIGAIFVIPYEIVSMTMGLTSNGFLENWFFYIYSVLSIPLSLAAWYLIVYYVSRQFERFADAYGAMLTGDPGAAITGLVKLARLNLMPLRWGKLEESMFTHPSIMRRAEAIAIQYGMSHDTLQELLHRPASASEDRYSIPPALSSTGHIFNKDFKRKNVLLRYFAFLFIGPLIPALSALFIRMKGIAVKEALIAYGLSTLILIIVHQFCAIFLGNYSYRILRKRLTERLLHENIDPEKLDSIYVGISSEPPRNYEGYSVWDIGFLFIKGKHLSYIGDQMRFMLPQDRIKEITFGSPYPNWWRYRSININWISDEGTSGNNLSLRPLNQMTPFFMKYKTQQIYDRIIKWWHSESHEDAEPGILKNLVEPNVPNVTGFSPFLALKPIFIIRPLARNAAVALVWAALFSVINAYGYIISVILLAMIFDLLPLLQERRKGIQ